MIKAPKVSAKVTAIVGAWHAMLYS